MALDVTLTTTPGAVDVVVVVQIIVGTVAQVDHAADPDIETDSRATVIRGASTHADVYRRTFHAW
jgi:hypothetical protein